MTLKLFSTKIQDHSSKLLEGKRRGELQSFIETYVAPVTSAMVDHKRRYTEDGAFLVRQIETVYFCLCFPNLISQTFFANGLPIVPFFSALLVTPYI